MLNLIKEKLLYNLKNCYKTEKMERYLIHGI